MRLIADANILFALAKETSTANFLVSKHKIKLITPDYALNELTKYKQELIKKSDIKNFQSIINSLKSKVIIINKSVYQEEIKSVFNEISDKKDVVYLALAKKLSLPIWSNDKHLKEQKEIIVFTTKELINLL